MSGSFRALVLTVTLLCGFAPQVACFLPDQALTQPEMDCCQKLANDCGQMNMSCCQTVVRPDLGIAAKVVSQLIPHLDSAARDFNLFNAMPAISIAGDSTRNDHAPPLDVGSSRLILRI